MCREPRGRARHRHHAFLGALAAYDQEPPVISEHPERQADEFADPHAGGIEKLEQGAKADAPQGFVGIAGHGDVGLRLGQQFRDVIDAENLGKGAALARGIDHAGRVVIAKTFGMEKLVELSQCGEPAGLGGRRKSPACKISYDTADVFGTGPWPAWFPET
jgi:hypothetical protein